jgi:hypothetical protein
VFIFALFFVLWYIEVDVEIAPELANGQNMFPDANLFSVCIPFGQVLFTK